MRHYSAKQRVGDQRWDYTCGNSPVGYCREYKEIPVGEYSQTETSHAIDEQFKHKHHTDGHATEQEACDCYKEYLLDKRLRFTPPPADPDTLYKCKVCGVFTAGFGQVGAYRQWPLCEEHRNRESVAGLIEVGESWES